MQFSCLATAYQYEPVYELVSRYDLGDEVLDWGCGNGHFSRYLTTRGIRTVGFSFDDAPPGLAGEPLFSHVKGVTSEPVALPFESGRFSTVFSIGVLEHVWETGGNDLASMREIHRVLRPSGRFICVHLPNADGWIEPTARKLGLIEHFHEMKYDEARIADLCKRSGFALLETGKYNFLPRNQLYKLPTLLSDTSAGVALINAVDRALGAIAPRYLQNFFFVAQKPATAQTVPGTS